MYIYNGVSLTVNTSISANHDGLRNAASCPNRPYHVTC